MPQATLAEVHNRQPNLRRRIAEMRRVGYEHKPSGPSARTMVERRDGLPARPVAHDFLGLLDACPAIPDLWHEASEGGSQRFEPTPECPDGDPSPDDFAGLTLEQVLALHPRFNDLIFYATLDGH